LSACSGAEVQSTGDSGVLGHLSARVARSRSGAAVDGAAGLGGHDELVVLVDGRAEVRGEVRVSVEGVRDALDRHVVTRHADVDGDVNGDVGEGQGARHVGRGEDVERHARRTEVGGDRGDVDVAEVHRDLAVAV